MSVWKQQIGRIHRRVTCGNTHRDDHTGEPSIDKPFALRTRISGLRWRHIALTSDEERDKVKAYDLNVAGYIIKPVTLAAFVEIMATLNQYGSVNELP